MIVTRFSPVHYLRRLTCNKSCKMSYLSKKIHCQCPVLFSYCRWYNENIDRNNWNISDSTFEHWQSCKCLKIRVKSGKEFWYWFAIIVMKFQTLIMLLFMLQSSYNCCQQRNILSKKSCGWYSRWHFDKNSLEHL